MAQVLQTSWEVERVREALDSGAENAQCNNRCGCLRMLRALLHGVACGIRCGATCATRIRPVRVSITAWEHHTECAIIKGNEKEVVGMGGGVILRKWAARCEVVGLGVAPGNTLSL